MLSTEITTALLALSAVGCGMTVVRLLLSKLYSRYKVFTFYFAFTAIANTLLVLFPSNSNPYLYIWATTEPISRIFCVLGVLELYRLMLEPYKGLYSMGRWVMYGASVLSVIISILLLLPHITPRMPQKSVHLGYVYAFNRGVDFTLTLFILLTLLFISQYPVSLSRNLLAHASLYSAYFLSSGTYALVRRWIGGGSASSLNLVFTAIVAACTVAWFFLLTPHGEHVKAVRIHYSPEYEARVLQHLDTINQLLLKSSKS